MDWTLAIGSINFGILDFVILGIFLLGGISGIALGFSRSALKILAYVACFPLALLFVEPLSYFFVNKFNMQLFLASLISYVLICLLIFILLKVVGNLLGTAFETLSLGWFDSLLGFIFCSIISVAVLISLFEVASLQHFVDFMPLKENSFLYVNVLCKLFPTMERAMKGALLAIR